MKKEIIKEFMPEFTKTIESNCNVMKREKDGTNWRIDLNCQWDNENMIYLAIDEFIKYKMAFYDKKKVLVSMNNGTSWQELKSPVFENKYLYEIKEKSQVAIKKSWINVGNLIIPLDNEKKEIGLVTSATIENANITEDKFKIFCIHKQNTKYAFKNTGMGKAYFVSMLESIVEKDGNVFYIDIDGNSWEYCLPLNSEIDPYSVEA